MKISLAGRFQKRVGLLFGGMLAVNTLGILNLLMALAVLAGMLLKNLKMDKSDWVYFVLWPAMALACLWVGRRLARQRQFYLMFGTWAEAEGGEAAPAGQNPESKFAALAEKQAFDDGDYSRSRRIFQKKAETELNRAEGHNLGSVLAQEGEWESLKAHFSMHESEGPRAKYARKFKDQPAFEKISGLTFAFVPLAVVFFAALAAIAYPAWEISSSMQAVMRGMTKEGFTSNEFETGASDHFIYYYHNERFMRWASEQAESALAYDLKFYALPEETYKNAKISLILSDSKNELLRRAPGTPSWEGGHAVPRDASVYIFKKDNYERDPYSYVVLAHELSHIVFFKLYPKLDSESWINEGIADYVGFRYALEKVGYGYKSWLLANEFADLKKEHLPFSDFLSSSPRKYEDVKHVQMFYTQGFSIAFTLIEYYGQDNFLRFMKEFSIDDNLEHALARSYPKIQTLQDLQGVWLLFMT